MQNWYSDDRRFIQACFGRDWQLIAALLAATSPQVHIRMSWNWTMEIYRRYKAGKQSDLSKYRNSHRANILRALAGEPLSGDKVSAFYENLTGNFDVVTIDTWMLKLFKWWDRGTKRVPTKRQYQKLSRAFQSIARQHGFEPAEFQAILWTHYRRTQGHKPVSYSSVGQDKRQRLFAFAEPVPF